MLWLKRLLGGAEPGGFEDGRRALAQGDFRAAAAAFDAAHAAAPRDGGVLAYRALARRVSDRAAAVADAERAAQLAPERSESHHALALCLATGDADFERAFVAFGKGTHLEPRDADGAVLYIGTYLLFIDVVTSASEDADGIHYEFKSTPLRDAADWLLGGHGLAAFKAFADLFKGGRQLPGALGLVAAGYRVGEAEMVREAAQLLAAEPDRLKPAGLGRAVELIREAV